MGMKEQILMSILDDLDPDDVMKLVQAVLPKILDSMDASERGEFLQELIEATLSAVLEGMNSEERASLMNKVLPVLLKEFPLEKLDILGVFGGAGTPE